MGTRHCLLQSERIGPLASQVIDATGCIVVPGLVDVHVHLIGGGGEAGPASRTPECQLSDLLNAGITTVVGVLGTDCISRRQVAFFYYIQRPTPDESHAPWQHALWPWHHYLKFAKKDSSGVQLPR